MKSILDLLKSAIEQAVPRKMPKVLVDEIADYTDDREEVTPTVIAMVQKDLGVLQTLNDKYRWENFSWKDANGVPIPVCEVPFFRFIYLANLVLPNICFNNFRMGSSYSLTPNQQVNCLRTNEMEILKRWFFDTSTQHNIRQYAITPMQNRYSGYDTSPEINPRMISFIKSNLEHAQFVNAFCTSINFFESNLNEANFNGAILIGALFIKCSMHKSDLSFTCGYQIFNPYLSGSCFAVFDKTTLTQANLYGSKYDNVEFFYCNLAGACMAKASFKNTKFIGCDLTDVDMSGKDQNSGANFSGAVFETNTQGRDPCKLTKANATNAVFTNALFVGANLREVNFTGANLIGARFTPNTDLTGAILEGAQFEISQFKLTQIRSFNFLNPKLQAGAQVIIDYIEKNQSKNKKETGVKRAEQLLKSVIVCPDIERNEKLQHFLAKGTLESGFFQSSSTELRDQLLLVIPVAGKSSNNAESKHSPDNT